MTILLGIFTVTLTILMYRLALRIHRKWPHPFTLPVLLSMIFIIIVLLIFQLSYEQYMIGGNWINQLLGPAVVALAYPLYIQRRTLLKLAAPLLIGTTVGAFTGVISGLLLTNWAGFSEEILYAISAKSVTTPVAVVITETLGGITSLAAIMVVIAGISGVIVHQYIFKLFGIHSELGRGLGMGSAAHAIGTAEVMKESQLAGSISTVAMVNSALVVSIITPWLVSLFL
ncbi:LrgB family protein [Salinicoccus sp. YB14-2]|uniref:LrgB family protein n=1 Tax=Salinicoccus sp. YB14-2 TaxID=1572701 RepID=UPI000690BB10|nr:LrgB family protein [Salinicoccus sp. YB14-2]